MSKIKAIVLDVDGVILDTSFLFTEISERGLKGDAMWDYFHEHCNSERVNLIEGFKDFYEDLHLLRPFTSTRFLLLTSRNEKVKEATIKKLNSEGIFFDEIYMRPEKDYRASDIIKKETLQALQEEYDIRLYVDDDLSNCEAAKSLGIMTYRKV